MTNRPVLVLNQNYEPLNICRTRRALVLIDMGRAEMLENGAGFIHTTTRTIPLPSVIRVVYMIKRPRPVRRLTRMEIFHRDNFTCQYCGKQGKQLTLDHIMPRYRGGGQSWENVVCACATCNRKKAGRTPEQAGMRLLSQPGPPKDKGKFYIPYQYRASRGEWLKYFPSEN